MNLVDIVVPGKRASAISGRVVTYRDGVSDSNTPSATPEVESRTNHPRTRNRPPRHVPARKKLIPSGERASLAVDSHVERSRQERLFPG